MKIKNILTASLAIAVFAAPLAEAQNKKPRFTKKDLERRYKEFEKASPKLREASGQLNDDQLKKAFNAVDEALKGKIDKRLEDEAKRLTDDKPADSEEARKALMDRAREIAPEDMKRIEESAIAQKLQNKVAPKPPEVPAEARKLANVTFTAAGGGSIKLPDMARVSWDGKRTPIEGHGPAPGRPPYTYAEMQERKNKDVQKIVITSTNGAYFAQDAETLAEDTDWQNLGRPGHPIAVFIENVFVDHPDFRINSDELIVYMRPGATSEEEGEEAPAAPAGVSNEKIREIIATGREVTIQRMVNGKVEVGKARRLEFDGNSGNTILIGDAQVQRASGNWLQGNRIILPENGTAEVLDGARLEIFQIRKKE